jgi:hypothetical protein
MPTVSVGQLCTVQLQCLVSKRDKSGKPYSVCSATEILRNARGIKLRLQ